MDKEVTYWQLFKLLILVVALMALLYVAVLLANDSKHRTGDANQEQQEGMAKFESQNVPDDMLPGNFPADLPTEDGAAITENKLSEVNDQGWQATRSYESTQSLAANYTTYTNYLRSNGWDVISQTNEPNFKSVTGKKGYQVLKVMLNPTAAANTVNVVITLNELPQR